MLCFADRESPLLHAKLFLQEEFFVLHAKFCRKIRFARSAAVAVGISERGKSLLDFLTFHVNNAGLPDVASLTCAEAGGISERGKSCSVWHRLFCSHNAILVYAVVLYCMAARRTMRCGGRVTLSAQRTYAQNIVAGKKRSFARQSNVRVVGRVAKTYKDSLTPKQQPRRIQGKAKMVRVAPTLSTRRRWLCRNVLPKAFTCKAKSGTLTDNE